VAWLLKFACEDMAPMEPHVSHRWC